MQSYTYFWNNTSFAKVFFVLPCRDDLQIVSKQLALIPTMYTIGDDVHIVSTNYHITICTKPILLQA